jgi:tetratricopeptide (TPR) repeat protein
VSRGETPRRALLALALLSFGVGAAAADGGAQALLDMKLGDEYAAKDDLTRAADAYVKALSEGRLPAAERRRMAETVSWSGRYADAAKEYRALLAENAGDSKARVGLAKTLAWMGDDKAALAEVRIVLRREPGDRDARLVEANAVRRTGDPAGAIVLYERILMSGDDFDARAGLAYAYLAAGDRGAARARAVGLHPRFPYQERELKELRAELAGADSGALARRDKKLGDGFAAADDLDRAADAYVKALSEGRFTPAERLKMAEVVSWAGRFPEAVKELSALADEFPADVKARTALAKTLSWAGDDKRARAEIDKALALAPDDRPALLVKANILRSAGDVKAAVELYDKILQRGDDFDARTGLAYALLAEGDAKGAAVCAASLEDLSPHANDDFSARTGGDYSLRTKGDGVAARACAASLKAQYPYQERERKGLVADLAADIKPEASSGGDDDVDALKRRLGGTSDKGERALLDKRIGDAYVAKEDFGRAAGFYVEALDLGQFSAADRMTLATRISWGDRLAAAAREFRALVKDDPSDVKAGVALARTLSWMGDNAGALGEIGKVLSRAPEDRDALLVKANALRLTGRQKEAVAVYRKLLEGGEDFDARLGLSYALLALGDRKGAVETAAPLTPKFPYQTNELGELKRELSAAVEPTFYAGFSYYNDTESNNVERYSLGYSQWLGGIKTDVDATDVEAKDATPRRDAADILSVKGYKKLSETVGAGAGIDLDVARNAVNSGFLTWNVKADERFANGAAGVSAVSYLMTDTAQLISSDIRATSYGVSGFDALTRRIILNGSYSYKDYSDVNGSNDVQLSPSYVLLLENPRVAVGYKVRYLGFRRQSGSGYYDPTSNIAQQIFTNVSFERGSLYGYAEPFGGHQTERRYAVNTNSYIYGGAGTLGYKASRGLTFEASAEGGNYAAQTASGFEYYQLGLRVVWIP